MTTYDDLARDNDRRTIANERADRDRRTAELQRLVDGWRGKQRLRHIPISACIAYGECADALAAALGNRSGAR